MTLVKIATLNVFTDVPFQDLNSNKEQERLWLRDVLLQKSNADIIMLQELVRPIGRDRLRKAFPDHELFSGYGSYHNHGWRTLRVGILFGCIGALLQLAAIHFGELLRYLSIIPFLISLGLLFMVRFIIVRKLDTTGLAILVRKKYRAKVLDCKPFKNRKHVIKDTYSGIWTKLEVAFQLTFLNYGWLRVRTEINGRSVDLISTHLTSPGPKSPDRHSVRYRMLQEIKSDAEVQIIAGDFNTEDPDDLLPLQNLVDSHDAKGLDGGYTLDCERNHIASYALLAGEPSHARRLDRIYCRNCEIISCKLLDDPICSDHFGVAAEMTI